MAKIDGDGTDVAPYRSTGHVAWIGDLEYYFVGDELVAAPVTAPFDPATGFRVGGRFESKLPAAASVLARHLAREHGSDPAWWLPEAERLLRLARVARVPQEVGRPLD